MLDGVSIYTQSSKNEGCAPSNLFYQKDKKFKMFMVKLGHLKTISLACMHIFTHKAGKELISQSIRVKLFNYIKSVNFSKNILIIIDDVKHSSVNCENFFC